MKKTALLFTILAFILVGVDPVCAQGIEDKTKELANVKSSIKAKQQEKDRLARQERAFKKELQGLDRQIANAEQKIKSIGNDIKVAEANLGSASQAYSSATYQRDALSADLAYQLEYYNRMTFKYKYDQNPIEYKFRRAGLEYKYTGLKKTNAEAESSSKEMQRWQDKRQDLLTLRKKENVLINDRKALVEKKNRLLKNTASQRRKAEDDIRKLQESARQMQSIIDNLIAERLRKEAAQKAAAQKKKEEAATLKPQASISVPKGPTISAAPAGLATRKSLPWPVAGTLVANFGRSKHPELDTYVISNGIKIQSSPGSAVKSVESGTVVFRGNISAYGKVIIIEHGNFYTVYGQLSDMTVSIGDKVKSGQTIGKLGQGGNNVLYFEIRRGDVPDNPILWLR
jgi:septal ring factor EnvC (AmiA/AmiB activator)